MNTKINWPTIEEVEKANNREELVAMGLCAWGNCYMEKPPEYFGMMMMVKIGERLGISPIAGNLHKLADEILSK